MEVYIDDEAKLTLHGLQQHYVKLKDSEKNRRLFELLDVLEFNQVILLYLEELGEKKIFPTIWSVTRLSCQVFIFVSVNCIVCNVVYL